MPNDEIWSRGQEFDDIEDTIINNIGKLSQSTRFINKMVEIRKNEL